MYEESRNSFVEPQMHLHAFVALFSYLNAEAQTEDLSATLPWRLASLPLMSTSVSPLIPFLEMDIDFRVERESDIASNIPPLFQDILNIIWTL